MTNTILSSVTQIRFKDQNDLRCSKSILLTLSDKLNSKFVADLHILTEVATKNFEVKHIIFDENIAKSALISELKLSVETFETVLLIICSVADNYGIRISNNSHLCYYDIKSSLEKVKYSTIICDFYNSGSWVDCCLEQFDFKSISVLGAKCNFSNYSLYQPGHIVYNLYAANVKIDGPISYPKGEIYSLCYAGLFKTTLEYFGLALLFSSWQQLENYINKQSTFLEIRKENDKFHFSGFVDESSQNSSHHIIGEIFNDEAQQDFVYEGELHGFDFTPNGNGLMLKENFYCLGEFKNGMLDGHGILVSNSNSTVIEGQFFEGKKNGSICEYTDEYKCTSTYENDMQTGPGLIYYKLGGFYEGYLNHNVPHGYGRLFNFNQGQYKGFFDRGLKSGEGELIFPTGSKYVGKFKQDSPEGYGAFYPINEEVGICELDNLFGIKLKIGNSIFSIESIRGQFIKHNTNGWVIMNIINLKTSRVFDAYLNIVAGVPCKWYSTNMFDARSLYVSSENFNSFYKGEIYYENSQDIYRGYIINGIRNGAGYYFNKSQNSEFLGEYYKGYKHGKGTLINSLQGYKYVGDFRYGKFHGQGAIELFNGDMIIGHFKKGMINGKAVYRYASGTILVCEFKLGKLSVSTGTVYERYFEGRYAEPEKINL